MAQGDSKELQEFVNVIKVQANDNKLAFGEFQGIVGGNCGACTD